MWPDEKLKIVRRCGAKVHSWMDRCRKTSMWRDPPTYPSNYVLDTNFEFFTLGLHWDIPCSTQHCTLTMAMSPLLRWISAHPRVMSLWMGRVRRVSFHARTAPCSDGHQNRLWHAIESSQQRIALACDQRNSIHDLPLQTNWVISVLSPWATLCVYRMEAAKANDGRSVM